MQIVIDIPEETYIHLCNGGSIGASLLIEYAIANGTVLPKGHGRLIDADALIKDVRDNSESYFADDFAHEWVDVAPTIIDADRSEEK